MYLSPYKIPTGDSFLIWTYEYTIMHDFSTLIENFHFSEYWYTMLTSDCRLNGVSAINEMSSANVGAPQLTVNIFVLAFDLSSIEISSSTYTMYKKLDITPPWRTPRFTSTDVEVWPFILIKHLRRVYELIITRKSFPVMPSSATFVNNPFCKTTS